MALLKVSEYYTTLSVEGKKRYETKLLVSGLDRDPYAIEESEWTRELQTIPYITWSDIMVYMLSTPSPHTTEAIKVL